MHIEDWIAATVCIKSHIAVTERIIDLDATYLVNDSVAFSSRT